MIRRTGLARARHGGESRRGGFSLIEMMIALTILSFGILAMMASQLVAMRFSTNSRDHTLAMKLAEQQMDTLLAMTPADVQALAPTTADPGNPLDPDTQDGVAMQFWRTTTVDLDTPEAGVMTMTVDVRWVNGLGNNPTASIQSFKADP
jgi:prepilin-type N-terminal cleavage/methylation domain-containing protein